MGQERSDRLRLAIVGCGQIGRLHAERLVADRRGRIVALCDPVPANAERLRETLAPEALVVTDFSQLAASGVVDAAFVCTPTNQHFDQVLQLRESGVHVLSEKPLADSRERIVQLIEAAAQGGPLLCVAYQRRCWSTVRTLRREVHSGRHGPVLSITSHNAERWQQTIDASWRDDPQFNPGGFIGDAGSHKLDMVFFVTGLAPQEVFAHSDRRGSHVEIVTTLSARLQGDVSLSMNFIGDAQHFREDFHVHCAEADLLLRDGTLWIARENQVSKISPLEPESNPDAAFIDCLTAGTANFAPAQVALPVWDFTQAVLESARTGTVIRLGSECPA
ncbi:MAG: Gfo/Idh/MocA family oxidoreductase [Planctomycetaceae bacterium]|nr:Gfo/Idh/MocA family oxidoreductase [Planctomycetaceae bacterium]